MTISAQIGPPALLTYDDYLAEPETLKRYEILDGVRVWMTNPSRVHQRIEFRLMQILEAFEVASGRGRMIHAPCDVLIRHDPLRTRQPDVLFISHERLAQCPPPDDPAPLPVGPELVVEILSPSETSRTVAEKLDDYRSVGVQEVWIVDPVAQTVELVRLTETGSETASMKGRGEEVASEALPGLVASVDRIFSG
jgi:Uma2 family endonuclease